MASEQLKLVIDVATAQAVRETKNLAKAFQDVNSEEVDLRSNAERTADALDAASSAIIADLKQSEAAANALGQSLGPELAAKIGDAKIDSFIADLRRMGLTFEEIEGNSDRFASSLRKMDESTGSIGNVEGAVKRLGHEGDNSRSVLANMVGNSVQDLGQLGGVAGSAGVMIGQLAEYAADGNISLAGLAKTAGPMLALAAGVGLITEAISSFGEHAAEVKKQTEMLVGVQKQLADQEYRAAASKLEEQYAGLIDKLKKYGLTTGEIIGAIQGNVDVSEKLNKVAADQSAAMDETTRRGRGANQMYVDQHIALIQTRSDLDDATQAYANAGDEIKTTTQLTGEIERALRGANAETVKVDPSARKAAEALAVMRDRLSEARQRLKDLQDQISGRKSLVDLELSLKGNAQQLDDLKKQFEDGKLTAEEYWLQVQSLTLDSQSKVADYATTLGNIPDDVATRITAELDPSAPEKIFGNLQSWFDQHGIHVTVGGMAVDSTIRNDQEGRGVPTPVGRGVDRPTAMRSDGAVVVQLQLNDRTVQEIMIRGDQLNRGRK